MKHCLLERVSGIGYEKDWRVSDEGDRSRDRGPGNGENNDHMTPPAQCTREEEVKEKKESVILL